MTPPDRIKDAWSVDAIPLVITLEEDGDPRPVSLLVVTEDEVLHQEVLWRLDGGASEVAAALAEGIRQAADRLGFWPDTVLVRHRDVQKAIAPLLAKPGVDVQFRANLPVVEDVALALMETLECPLLWPPVGRSGSWLGWGLPEPLVAELFREAATFWNAEPWRVMQDVQSPRCTLPSGREWECAVAGNNGVQFGLLLFSEDPDDAVGPDSEEPPLGFQLDSGRTLSLMFEPLSDMPDRGRKEIATHGWPVADARGCPTLVTMNTPGGGVSEDEVRDLMLVLRAMPRFARCHGPDLEREMEVGQPANLEWTDVDTGVAFRYRGEAAVHMVDLPSWSEVFDALPDEAKRAVEEMQRWLEEEEGMEVPGVPEAPAQLAGVPAYEGIRALLELAADSGQLDGTQTGNLKVAVVRAWVDRVKNRVEEWSDLDRGRRFWEDDVPSLHWLRVLADLGGWLRPRGGGFLLTPDGRRLLEPGREGELYARLFEVCFQQFNLAYLTQFEWPEGQHQAAFTLYRLGDLAVYWTTARALLDRGAVARFAQAHLPETAFMDVDWVFEIHLLRRLVRFGLMERRRDEDDRRHAYRVTPRYVQFLEFRV